MVPFPPILKSRPPLVIALFSLSAFLYLIHRTFFQLSSEELRIVTINAARPIRGRFPSWYGNSDVVGPSPWDFEPRWDGSEGRKRRVLFLTDYPDYLERMDTVIYELVDASLRHPALIVDVWGPGWGDWDSSASVSANLGRRWGCGYWDVVWTFAWLLKKDDPLMDAPGCDTIFVHQLGDCHEGSPDGSCMQEWFPYQGNITIARYAFELTDLFTHERIMRLFPGHKMHLFGHSPDGANPWDFYPLPSWTLKKRDAVLFGFEGSFYPLRSKISSAISNKQTSIVRHDHPGYGISQPESALTNRPTGYELGSELHVNHVKTREVFAKGMREARICVFDASLERKMIRKYAQAMLSGCVIAADVPTEMEDELSKFIIRLEPFWSIEEINTAITTALASPQTLQHKALLGFAYAREHLTNLYKVDRVILGLVDDYEKGQRGYKFPFGFSMRCRAYWGNTQDYRPPWCGNSYLGLEGPESYGPN